MQMHGMMLTIVATSKQGESVKQILHIFHNRLIYFQHGFCATGESD